MSQMLTSHLLSKVSSPWYLNWDHFPRSVISIIRLRSGITQGKILKLYTRTENFPAVRMLVVPNNIMETYIAGRWISKVGSLSWCFCRRSMQVSLDGEWMDGEWMDG